MKDYLSKPEINFFLSITIPLIALAVSWGMITTRVDHVEKMAIGLQDQVQLQREENQIILVRLAEMQKDILYIRQALDSRIK